MRRLQPPFAPPWVRSAGIGVAGLLAACISLLLTGVLQLGLLFLSTLLASAGWAWEHWRGYQRLVYLADQIGSGKLEVDEDPYMAVLQRAINDAVQQRRKSQKAVAADPQMLTALAIGLREGPLHSTQARNALEQLAAQIHELARDHNATVQTQGNGLFVMLFGLNEAQSLAHSSTAAVKVAERLHARFNLRFGMSCGMGTRYASPWGNLIVAGAVDDATRLLQMARSWGEYDLLCPEPLAILLAPTNSTSRTPLEITHPGAPALRVYMLDLKRSSAFAVGA